MKSKAWELNKWRCFATHLNLTHIGSVMDQHEGNAVLLKINGIKVLKREILSMILLVNMQARKLEEIKMLEN
jgi:hypothetical protein